MVAVAGALVAAGHPAVVVVRLTQRAVMTPVSKICTFDGCTRQRKYKELCPMHDMRRRRHGDPAIQGKAAKGEPLVLLTEWVNSRDRSSCWLDWPYAREGAGYPAINGRKAGWVILELDGRPRPLPPANEMLHGCDQPPCLNPTCLSWGTHRENMRQSQERGRAFWAPRGHANV